MAQINILLDDIMEYLGRTSRPMREGEAVLRADHVVRCGIKNDEILAYVIQSSNIKGNPHKINIKLDKDPKKWSCKCSCAAGEGGMCKHIVAVLLYVNRNSIDEITCTDVEQQWGKDCAQGTQSLYKKAVRLRDFCHVKTKESLHVNNNKDNEEGYLQALLKCKPHSALAKVVAGRKSVVTETLNSGGSAAEETEQFRSIENKENASTSGCFAGNALKYVESANSTKYAAVETVFQHALLENEIVDFLATRNYEILNKLVYEQKVERNVVECKEVYMKTLGQNTDVWKQERLFRITASTCYNLYTYSKNKNPDWEKKATKYISPTFSGNVYTQYGAFHEKFARTCYEVHTGKTVLESGLVIHPQLPWFACSPDGITSDFDFIIEIKCPVLGAKETAIEVLKKLKYIQFNNDVYSLKRKHVYFGQIQLVMFILNISKCHFVVYSSYDNTCVILEELYDEEFVKNLVANLKETYFCKMLSHFHL